MQTSDSLPRWNVAVWFLVFVSPTAYFVILLLGDRFQIAPPPEQVVALLFIAVPLAALLVCESMVLVLRTTVARKIQWMLITLFAVSLQFAILVAIVVMATGQIQ